MRIPLRPARRFAGALLTLLFVGGAGGDSFSPYASAAGAAARGASSKSKTQPSLRKGKRSQGGQIKPHRRPPRRRTRSEA